MRKLVAACVVGGSFPIVLAIVGSSQVGCGSGSTGTTDSGAPDRTAAESGVDHKAPDAHKKDAREEAMARDAGEDRPSHDSGADTKPSDAGKRCEEDAGVGGVGILGCPCSTVGALGCNGNASKETLVCTPVGSGLVWLGNGACAGTDRCDSRLDAGTLGTCVNSFPCTAPGAPACSPAVTLCQCSADGLPQNCTPCVDSACPTGGTACVGTCSPYATTTSRCSGIDVQACSLYGTWETTQVCGGCGCIDYALDGGASYAACNPSFECYADGGGGCVPGSTRCEGDMPQVCDADDAGTGWVSNGSYFSCGYQQCPTGEYYYTYASCVTTDAGAGCACPTICTPGASQCGGAGGGQPQVCNDAGTEWVSKGGNCNYTSCPPPYYVPGVCTLTDAGTATCTCP